MTAEETTKAKAKRSYSPATLERKRQLMAQCLEVVKQRKAAAQATPEITAPQEIAKTEEVCGVPPTPSAPPSKLTEESEKVPVKKQAKSKKEAKAKPQPVYLSSSEEDEDDEKMILVSRQTIKKYRQLKKQVRKSSESPPTVREAPAHAPAPAPAPTPASSSSPTDKIIAQKWQDERQRALLKSIFPGHSFL